jgi:hypothetical protein
VEGDVHVQHVQIALRCPITSCAAQLAGLYCVAFHDRSLLNCSNGALSLITLARLMLDSREVLGSRSYHM